jgi:hypothetical protein
VTLLENSRPKEEIPIDVRELREIVVERKRVEEGWE